MRLLETRAYIYVPVNGSQRLVRYLTDTRGLYSKLTWQKVCDAPRHLLMNTDHMWTVGIHRGSYRAIVTNNDNLVGITEHHEGNNVRSIYDVNERIKSGAYLNDGSIPETIHVERQVFHRKDIANVIYGQARGDKYKNVVGDVSLFPEAGPIDKLWMEPAVNGMRRTLYSAFGQMLMDGGPKDGFPTMSALCIKGTTLLALWMFRT